MIEILKMQVVGKNKNLAIMYFDFLFQNMNELPNIVYTLGNMTYAIADGSTAIHGGSNNMYKYTNGKWFKVATITPPEIPNPDYVDGNGEHNIPNNEVHGYRTLNVNVPQGGGGTTDYDELTNKPTINGIELAGTLSGSDLGLQDNIIGQDGTIEPQYIPADVFERMCVVENDNARFTLTTDEVQNGDIVYVNDTKMMYYVYDDTKLNNDDGYKSFSAGIAAKAVGDEDGNNIKSTYVRKSDEYNAGKTVPQGTQVTIDGQTYIVGQGAEIFNAYGDNKAVGDYTHAEGIGTIARDVYSHAEGSYTKALGNSSHAEGAYTEANGMCSHAEGEGTIVGVGANYQHVEGRYNVVDNNKKFAYIIGNGDKIERSNAFAIDWDGKIYTNNSGTGVDVCTDLQSKIDSTNKLSADLVDDASTTHKFATSEQLSQIATNTEDIATLKQEMGDINSALEEML